MKQQRFSSGDSKNIDNAREKNINDKQEIKTVWIKIEEQRTEWGDITRYLRVRKFYYNIET